MRTIEDLQCALSDFAEERDWNQYHSPKNLAMALAGEVGELIAHFQWMTESESHLAAIYPEENDPIALEMADVMIYLARLASVMDIDLLEVCEMKMELNAEKYPKIQPTSDAL